MVLHVIAHVLQSAQLPAQSTQQQNTCKIHNRLELILLHPKFQKIKKGLFESNYTWEITENQDEYVK